MDTTLPPGPALYFDDFPDAPPQACEVFESEGQRWVRFPRTDEDDGAEIPVDELTGRLVRRPDQLTAAEIQDLRMDARSASAAMDTLISRAR